MYHHNIIIIIESKQASIDVKHSQPFSIKHTGGRQKKKRSVIKTIFERATC